MDFGVLPPEINSGRMYAGPGSGPMLAAAAAWDGLATELQSTAADYGSVISVLTGVWSGQSSGTMAAAAAPYVAWMSATAALAREAAAQASAAAAAYEAAFAATVPPPVVAAPSWRCWRRPTFSVRTPVRSRPPKPAMRKCGRKTQPRCMAMPARRRWRPR